MFSCLYKLIWIQVQHQLLKIQERRRQGLLRLLFRGKGDEGPHDVSSSSPSAPRFPPSPLFSSFFSCSPSRTWILLTSPLEERKRQGLLHLLPRGKRGGDAHSAPLLRLVFVAAPPSPCSPPPSSPTPPVNLTQPLHPDVCIVAFPAG